MGAGDGGGGGPHSRLHLAARASGVPATLPPAPPSLLQCLNSAAAFPLRARLSCALVAPHFPLMARLPPEYGARMHCAGLLTASPTTAQALDSLKELCVATENSLTKENLAVVKRLTITL